MDNIEKNKRPKYLDVLVLCQYFYPEKITSGTLPFEMAEKFAKDGYKVSALVGMPNHKDNEKLSKKEWMNGIHIKRISYMQLDRKKSIGRLMNYFSFSIAMFFRFLSFRHVKTIIVYSDPPMLPMIPTLFKKLFKFSLINVIYDIYPDAAIKYGAMREDSITAKAFERMNHHANTRCDKIIVMSDDMKQYLVQNKKLHNSSIEVVPNWYMDTGIHPHANENIKKNTFTVLYGGNMGICQDLDTLTKCMILMKNQANIRFKIAGHGSKKNSLLDIVKKENIENCFIYDFLEKKEYDLMMKEADAFVVSLDERSLGLGSPSKVYSYLSAGKPILAIMPKESDVVKDIVEYDCGFYIEQGKAQQLVDAIHFLDKNPKEAIKKGENGYNLFKQKYTRDICVSAYEKIIDKLEER